MIMVPEECVRKDSVNCGIFCITYVNQILKHSKDILTGEKIINKVECGSNMAETLRKLYTKTICDEVIVLQNDTKWKEVCSEI